MARRKTTESFTFDSESDLALENVNDLNILSVGDDGMDFLEKESVYCAKNIKHAILDKECYICKKPYKNGVNVGMHKTCGRKECIIKASKI